MKKYLTVVSLLAANSVLQAQAAPWGDEKLSISGFGTLAAARSDTDEVQFARYNQKAGVGDSPRIGLDSNLGLQASYTMTPDLSATVQLLTRKSTSESFSTELSWAFLKYKLDDEINVRAGRMLLPAFLISDYQNVGYANTMMRPPIEVYAQEPLENVDGADINWQHAFGDTNLTAQAFLGKSSGKIVVAGFNAVAHYDAPAYGISLSAEQGPVTIRAAHLRSKVQVADLAALNSLTDTLAALGFSQLASDLTLREAKHLSFTSIGVMADWRNIVLQSEYAWRRAQDPAWVPQTNAWYAMAGYRIGKVLPYYAHSHYNGARQKFSVPAAVPPALAATVNALAVPGSQSSDLIGLRWDVAKSLALKAQWDRVKPSAKAGFLIYGPPTYRNTVDVLAAGFDFVF